MKILYISYFYPPFNTIGGMRSFGQVQALTDMGCDVKVISCADQGFEINDDFREKSLSNVLFKKKYNSSKPMEIVVGSKLPLRKKLKALALRSLPKFLLRIISLLKTLIFLGKDNPGWTKIVLQDYKKDLGDWSPDIVFSTFSPIDSHIIASKISSDLNIRWAAEFRDCWSFNTMLFSKKESELSAKILRAIENKILSNCSIIFAATPFIKSYYERHHLKETELLLGGWEEKNQIDNEKLSSQNYIFDDVNQSKANNKIKILHLGSMLHGTRSILPIVQMLEGNPALSERFEFEFVGRDSTIFQPMLNKSSAKDSITLCDHVTFNEAEKIGYSADILLVIMKKSSMEKHTLTGKIFEYIKFSKPIISLDSYDSEVSALIKKYRLGYHVKNINEFQLLLKSKPQLSDYKKVDDQTRLEFKRVNQIQKVLKRLKDFT